MRTRQDLYRADFRDIVVQCMIAKGADPSKCFECGTPLTSKSRQIHHLKYDGATIDDLRFGCSKCNNQVKYQNLI